MRRQSLWALAIVFASGLVVAVAALAAGEPISNQASALPASVFERIGLGATAAFAIAATVWGSAYAVARIGSAAMGAAAEKPELLNRSLLFVALAEGLAVLGFVVAIMIVQQL